jgi:NADPH:quinone reductase-like Zn-dependent oxidoreductase
MKAWIGTGRGAEVSYALHEIAAPALEPDELLLRVKAVGINRVDQYPTGSHFSHSPAAPAAIPGLEAAGEVVAVGAAVRGFHVGDRVAAMVQGGSAELVRVRAAIAMPLPPAMSWVSAAAVPVSYLTAHNALVTLGGIQSGASLLIHAATTGVGIATLQLAVRRGVPRIAGSSGSAEKLERLRGMGLTLGLHDPYRGFADAVCEHTGGRGVDVAVDNIGGALLNDTMRCTALGGTIVNVGRLGGIESNIDLNLHALRRIRLLGATFRTRSLEEHAQIVRDFLRDHGQDLADGTLSPLIDSVYGFDELPAAIRRSRQRQQLGKIVLEARG